MDKIQLKSNSEYMIFYLNHPINDTNPLQELIKLRYLLALTKNEKELRKLDFYNAYKAKFNNYASKMIGEEIIHRLDNNDKTGYDILKSETARITYETSKYQTGNVRIMPYETMKFILTEYIKEDKVTKELDNLYSFLPSSMKVKTAKILRLHK